MLTEEYKNQNLVVPTNLLKYHNTESINEHMNDEMNKIGVRFGKNVMKMRLFGRTFEVF